MILLAKINLTLLVITIFTVLFTHLVYEDKSEVPKWIKLFVGILVLLLFICAPLMFIFMIWI